MTYGTIVSPQTAEHLPGRLQIATFPMAHPLNEFAYFPCGDRSLTARIRK